MTSLPIDEVIPDLLAALRGRTCALLIAPPGAGKTTRVAPALLQEDWCTGQVLLLVPRRLAARAAAEFMAGAFDEKPGTTIGYATRLDSKIGKSTRVIAMTHGVFLARIEADPGSREAAVLIEGQAGWHRGVLGIAASKLAREYHRPVLLFGLEEGRASGSGRSIPGVSLHGVLSEMTHFFAEFGGHEQAVGGSLPSARFEEFRRDARELFARRVSPEALLRIEHTDGELPLEAIDEALVDDLSRLEPHGASNPVPVFLARGVRAAGPLTAVGVSGLRGRLSSGSGGRSIGCIAWGTQAREDSLLPRLSGSHAPMDVLYRIESRRGYPTRVEILDCRPEVAA